MRTETHRKRQPGDEPGIAVKVTNTGPLAMRDVELSVACRPPVWLEVDFIAPGDTVTLEASTENGERCHRRRTRVRAAVWRVGP